MRALTSLVAVLLLAVTCGSPLACVRADAFPVPRAEAEFEQLVEVPRGFASRGKVSFEQIQVNVMPFAPLDLQVTGKATHEEVSLLKNMYFGAVCRILEVDPGDLLDTFMCAEGCVERRWTFIQEHLAAWSEVAADFTSARNVTLMAVWGAPVAYRINDVVHAGGKVMTAVPSKVMGFIPGGTWRAGTGLSEILAERNINAKVVVPLVRRAADAGVIALRRREAGGVELIHSGMADNLSGALFLPEGRKPPAVQDEHESGSRYVIVERLGAGIYFFETR